jgi:hypothetical protein
MMSKRRRIMFEDVSPPVFSMVALTIVGICLAVFFVLGMFP